MCIENTRQVVCDATRRIYFPIRIFQTFMHSVYVVTSLLLLHFLQSMMQIKEKKDMEDAFKKAQKPWAKLLQKVDKARTDYHTACKTEKSAANQERNAAGDSSFSVDQVNY